MGFFVSAGRWVQGVEKNRSAQIIRKNGRSATEVVLRAAGIEWTS